MDAVFRALADPTRRQLLDSLYTRNGQTLNALCERMDMTRQAVTKHLHVLADAGLVRHVKVGRERRWEFEPSQVEEARRSLEMIARQWDHALGKLKMAVER